MQQYLNEHCAFRQWEDLKLTNVTSVASQSQRTSVSICPARMLGFPLMERYSLWLLSLFAFTQR
jgi:hypothetical protein